MYSKNQAKRYCCEDVSKIENFEKANTSDEFYEFHHRKEIELDVDKEWLIANDLYYNRPASELILLTKKEHRQLHMTGKYVCEKSPIFGKVGNRLGKHHTAEAKEKNRLAHLGSNHPLYGKKHKESTIKKMSDARSEWWSNHRPDLTGVDEMYLNGMTVPQISKKIGRSMLVIRDRLKELGIYKDTRKAEH